MITKFQNYKLITEDPDHVYFNVGDPGYDEDTKLRLSFTDKDAKPFFLIVNQNHTKVEKIVVGKFGDYHNDLTFIEDKHRKGYSRLDHELVDRTYPGRLWTKHKIITFWIYPDEKLFIQMILLLEKKLRRKIFNKGWKVEVIKNDKGDVRKNLGVGSMNFDRKYSDSDDIYFKNAAPHDDDDYIALIPIEKYGGSLNVPEEKRKLPHLMTPTEKWRARQRGEIEIAKGWGSDLTAWDGKRPLPYRQAIYQENKNINDN